METFEPFEFEWDDGNIRKNWIKHKVKHSECEDVFFNKPIVLDIDRSKILYKEERKISYGLTNANRLLTVVFTIRNRRIRIISARDMSRTDRRFYYEERKKTDSF